MRESNELVQVYTRIGVRTASFRLRVYRQEFNFASGFCIIMNIQGMNKNELYASLDARGYAVIPSVLSDAECRHLIGFYADQHLFRSVICMERYRFGKGEYKYFGYPLPPVVQALREIFYHVLSDSANQWMKKLGMLQQFPAEHAEFIEQCHLRKQDRPTPLILRYAAGGYNTLHQDLYGDVFFPFQVVVALTQQGRDYEGGELVLTEQVPRAQSKAEVVKPDQGDVVIFTTNFRPVKGTKCYYRAHMKHGVSQVRSGERYALGIIFHDAA